MTKLEILQLAYAGADAIQDDYFALLHPQDKYGRPVPVKGRKRWQADYDRYVEIKKELEALIRKEKRKERSVA